MNLSEGIKLSTEVSQRLFLCQSKAEVEQVFSEFKISHVPDKIGLLKLSMGAKHFSSSPDNLTPEQRYEDELLIFLEGSWRFLV